TAPTPGVRPPRRSRPRGSRWRGRVGLGHWGWLRGPDGAQRIATGEVADVILASWDAHNPRVERSSAWPAIALPGYAGEHEPAPPQAGLGSAALLTVCGRRFPHRLYNAQRVAVYDRVHATPRIHAWSGPSSPLAPRAQSV